MILNNKRATSNKLFVYLTCLYVITWYLQLNSRVEVLGAIRFEFLLGSMLIVLGLLHKNDSVSKKNPLLIFVFAYFISLLIQIPFSYDQMISRDFFINRVLKFSMLAFFIVKFINDPWALRMFVGAYLLACFKLGQESFFGWATGSLVWQNQGIDRLHGSIPILAHPNSLSGFGVNLLPFIFYLYGVISAKVLKVLLLILFLFSLIIIVYTGSRTGYVGTIGVIGYIIWQSKNKYKAVFLVILSVPIGLQFIPVQYTERFESIFTGQEREPASTSKRIQILEDAIEVFKRHPFGVGIHAFPSIRADLFGRRQDTHNLYLEILTNLGIQGFIIFAILIRCLFKVIAQIRGSLEKQIQTLLELCEDDCSDESYSFSNLKKHIMDLQFLLAVINAVGAFVVARLVLGLFGMDLYEIYWWLAIGLVVAVFKINESLQNDTDSYLSFSIRS